MNRFTGKSIIVTGAASGIGRATAERLAAEGGKVACLDVSPSLSTVVEAIVADGGTAAALECNVADVEQVRSAVADAVDQYGPTDVLCNIAGIGRYFNSTEMTPEQWQRIIDVNLTGTWFVAQAVLPHMLDRGGVILNTASTSGMFAQPWQAAYCASKGGVVMLTKALALEYWDRKLRVNAIAPGGVETPIIQDFSQLPEGGSFDRITRYMSPMGFCKPADLASLYAYVGSDEAHYMTGSVVLMDGGMTL
ncbi:MAG TPA: SDR family NAD(P)-dependent oxidoreductase [Acidimicrobiales bacterium]|jgi:NAD(P)-dependent dehydrogenase (short-subunit alcohol dehydrogenase family)|nr:SDR family NAD(P)-dependent oxidoreductase [Acidimicrobiales bacterium]